MAIKGGYRMSLRPRKNLLLMVAVVACAALFGVSCSSGSSSSDTTVPAPPSAGDPDVSSAPRDSDGSRLTNEDMPDQQETTDRIEAVKAYFNESQPDYELALVGKKENLEVDLSSCDQLPDNLKKDLFIHLDLATNSSLLDSLPSDIQSDIEALNSEVSDITGVGCAGNDLGVHTLGLVPKNAVQALVDAGYGKSDWMKLRVYKR